MKYSCTIKNLLLHSGTMACCRRLPRPSQVAILRYHSIVRPADNFYASPSICLSPELFEQHVRYIAQHYTIIDLDTVADCLRERRSFPERAVVFTFDDGYRDNFDAYLTLKRYGATGTFYIAAGCIGNAATLWLYEVIHRLSTTGAETLTIASGGRTLRIDQRPDIDRWPGISRLVAFIKGNTLAARDETMAQLRQQTADVTDTETVGAKVMLDWQHVTEMSDNGMTIGGHTMTHLNLPNALPADAEQEIRECKRLIEEKTGRPCHHFSYPNGGDYSYYTDQIKQMVIDAGYSTSTTSNNGLALSVDSDPFELKRVRITDHLAEVTWQIDCAPLIDRLAGGPAA